MLHKKPPRSRHFLMALLVLTAMLVQPWNVYGQQDSGGVDAYLQPDEHLVTLSPSLSYQGHLYEIYVFVVGKLTSDRPQAFFNWDDEDYARNGVAGLLITSDGEVITDENTIREILTLYRAAIELYIYKPPYDLGNVDDSWLEDFRKVSSNPLFIEQWVKRLFSTRRDETAEALRAILTAQIASPGDIQDLGSTLRSGAGAGNNLIDVIDDSLEAARFSNSRQVRTVAKDIRDTFRSWQPVTEQGTAYVDIGKSRVEFANALDVLDLAVRLMWLSDLQHERSEWLSAFSMFADGEATLDADQQWAAAVVAAEVDDSWTRRADIVLDFVNDQTLDLGVRVAEEVLAKGWVDWSWKTFGKRTTGHLVAGAASSVLLGLTLGNILYGLDDLHHNFIVGERSDELRRRFRDERKRLQDEAERVSTQTYDGELASRYRIAYMLEALSAAQMLRSYADGTAATVRQGILSFINPINWFKGKEWRDAVADLRQMGDDVELAAEADVGHPDSVDGLVALIMRRLNLDTPRQVVTIDDTDPGFSQAGAGEYWELTASGIGGRAYWTYNEANKSVNYARWSADGLKAGLYLVEAFISQDGQFPKPLTGSARYVITHQEIQTTHVTNQVSVGGWLSLGVYAFSGENDEYVQLDDQTGEPTGSTIVYFDAVRWTPITTAESDLAASAATSISYDIVVAGETAQIDLKVSNTGNSVWFAPDFTLETAANLTDDSPLSWPLAGDVHPGGLATWTIELATSGLPGVRSLRYQMHYNGQPFGNVMTAYIIVLPEQLRDTEQRIRDQIEEWQQQGEQAAEEFMQRIWEEIQKEIERQATNFIEDLFSQCFGSIVIVGFAIALVYQRSRYRH